MWEPAKHDIVQTDPEGYVAAHEREEANTEGVDLDQRASLGGLPSCKPKSEDDVVLPLNR
jgi:hypothetical protein